MRKLNAAQIRLGNYIMSGNNGNYCSSGLIGKVLEIGNDDREFEQIYCECEESYEWFFKGNYFPIPLTKEWLYVFGFKINRATKKNNNIWRREWTDGYFELEEITSFFFGYPVHAVEVETVDHLQNLFYFITGEELAAGSMVILKK